MVVYGFGLRTRIAYISSPTAHSHSRVRPGAARPNADRPLACTGPPVGSTTTTGGAAGPGARGGAPPPAFASPAWALPRPTLSTTCCGQGRPCIAGASSAARVLYNGPLAEYPGHGVPAPPMSYAAAAGAGVAGRSLAALVPPARAGLAAAGQGAPPATPRVVPAAPSPFAAVFGGVPAATPPADALPSRRPDPPNRPGPAAASRRGHRRGRGLRRSQCRFADSFHAQARPELRRWGGGRPGGCASGIAHRGDAQRRRRRARNARAVGGAAGYIAARLRAQPKGILDGQATVVGGRGSNFDSS